MEEIQIGKGRLLKTGSKLAIISIGHPGNFVSQAIEEYETPEWVAHYDLRFVKPLDEDLLHEVCSRYKNIITVEDGTLKGGMGSAVVEFINEHNYSSRVTKLGVTDRFVEHGKPEELYRECGFDKDGILKTIANVLSKE